MTIRVEIIANYSVQEDLLELLDKHNVGQFRTLIPQVQGKGSSGPRRGDHIWPEENFIMIIFCERSEAKVIRKAVDELKEYFPDEGIKMFATCVEKV
ncbi:MAG: hypothetical protein P8107_02645 [Spirochaetia bacterium]|jgi:hypothetical protein